MQRVDDELADRRPGIGKPTPRQRRSGFIRQYQLLVSATLRWKREPVTKLSDWLDVLPSLHVLHALRNRRNDPAAEDAAGDESAHREQPRFDLPDAHHDRRDYAIVERLLVVTIDALLMARAVSRSADTGGDLPPLREPPAGVVRADGFGAADRVDEQALALVAARELVAQ